MAGDWIPIDPELPKQRKVIAMGRRCGWSAYEFVGRLIEFWGWVTLQPVLLLDDGERGAIVDVSVDGLVDAGVAGREFLSALISFGWLEEGEVDGQPSIVIPKYNSWLSKCAKGRLLKAQRQRRWRQAGCLTSTSVDAPVDGGVDAPVDGQRDAQQKKESDIKKEKKGEKGKGKGKREEGKGERGKGERGAPDIAFPEGFDAPEVRKAVTEWLDYKRKRGETYKSPARQMGLLLKIKDEGQRRFPAPVAFIAAVEHSIANNYSGCYPPKGSHGQSGRQRPVDTGARIRD